jgi:hypothetical protein
LHIAVVKMADTQPKKEEDIMAQEEDEEDNDEVCMHLSETPFQHPPP